MEQSANNKLPKLPGVYRIENRSTGEFYIGSARNLHKRKGQHLNQIRNGYHTNYKVLKSFYGDRIEDFNFIVLEVFEDISLPELLNVENLYIEKFNATVHPGMNLRADAFSSEGSKKGPCPEERKQKIAESVKQTWTPRHCVGRPKGTKLSAEEIARRQATVRERYGSAHSPANIEARDKAFTTKFNDCLANPSSPESIVLTALKQPPYYIRHSDIVRLISKSQTSKTIKCLTKRGLLTKVSPGCYTLVETANRPDFTIPEIIKVFKSRGPQPQETKLKISQSNKGKKRTPEMVENNRRISSETWANKKAAGYEDQTTEKYQIKQEFLQNPDNILGTTYFYNKGFSSPAVRSALSRLCKEGFITKVSHGIYKLSSKALDNL